MTGPFPGMCTQPYAPPPSFDATGVGETSVGGASSSFSFSHTATAGAYVLLAFVNASNEAPSNILYGGSAMSSLGSVANNNVAADGSLYLYGLAGVTGGAKTVSGSFAAATNYAANTVSYLHVASVGAVVTQSGSSASPSTGSTTCPAGQMIVAAIGSAQEPLTPTGGTLRFNGSSGFTAFTSLAISDASATTTFSATMTSGPWSTVTVILT
jgi:hypothetical protein